MIPDQQIALKMAFFILAVVVAASAAPVESRFIFQGQLKDEGAPANGPYDMVFRLYGAASGGSEIGSAVTVNDWTVTNGLFAVSLDFGASPFDGNARWLQVEVRSGSSSDAYTVLSPRQPLTAAPYALYALNGPGGDGPWTTSGTNAHNTNAGNVGIGTSTPAAPLHVAGDIRSDGPLGVASYNPNNSDSVVALGWINDTARIRVGGNGPGASNGLDIQRTGDRSMMRFLGNGNIGVGTTDPNAKMHIVSNGIETAMRITNGGGVACSNITNSGLLVSDVCGDGRAAGFYGVTSNTLVTVQNDGSGKAATFAGDVTFVAGNVDFAGNVGIGTSSPVTKLHVTGGSDTAPGGGGFLVTGNTSGANISIDNNEIMARNNGVTSSLYLNANGGDVHVGPGDLHVGGNVTMGYEIVNEIYTGSSILQAICPEGKVVLGGGCNCGSGDVLESSTPTSGSIQGTIFYWWTCVCDGSVVSAYAICANMR